MSETKTSDQWHSEFPNVEVLSPDGWDRNNFHHSWHEEKITKKEFIRRVRQSTCKLRLSEGFRQAFLHEPSDTDTYGRYAN